LEDGAELINLRRARKAKAKSEKDKAADANRVTHGTPKQLRDLAKAHATRPRAIWTRIRRTKHSCHPVRAAACNALRRHGT